MMNLAAERQFQAEFRTPGARFVDYEESLREANRIGREWRSLRVKIAAHRAAVRSKHLPRPVTRKKATGIAVATGQGSRALAPAEKQSSRHDQTGD